MIILKYDAWSILTANKHTLLQHRTPETGFLHYKLVMGDINPKSINIGDAMTDSYSRLIPDSLNRVDPLCLTRHQKTFSEELRECVAPLFSKLSNNIQVEKDHSFLVKEGIIKPIWDSSIKSQKDVVSDLLFIIKKLKEGLVSVRGSHDDIECLMTIVDAYNSMPCLTSYILSPKFIPIFGMVFFYTYVYRTVLLNPSFFQAIVYASIEDLYVKTYSVKQRVTLFIYANPLSIQLGVTAVWFSSIYGIVPLYVYAKDLFLQSEDFLNKRVEVEVRALEKIAEEKGVEIAKKVKMKCVEEMITKPAKEFYDEISAGLDRASKDRDV